jgi:hypothetical protein
MSQLRTTYSLTGTYQTSKLESLIRLEFSNLTKTMTDKILSNNLHLIRFAVDRALLYSGEDLDIGTYVELITFQKELENLPQQETT